MYFSRCFWVNSYMHMYVYTYPHTYIYTYNFKTNKDEILLQILLINLLFA